MFNIIQIKKSGVILKTRVSEGTIQTSDNYMPIKDTNLSMQVPQINGQLPERVKVIAISTKATNGKEGSMVEFGEDNWNYDNRSGLLNIAYQNKEDKDGNIYSEYQENAKDEFEIIYIYPQASYTGNGKEVKISVKANILVNLKQNENEIKAERAIEETVTLKDNIGDIVTFDKTSSTDIYKGYLYSNVKNKTNYETEYSNTFNLDITNAELMDSVTATIQNSEFVQVKDNKDIFVNIDTYYKSTEISKYDFDTILGEDGYIEIFSGEEKIASVKYNDVKKDKKLQVTYSDKTVKDVEDKILVEYENKVSNITIKTSKPKTEGTIKVKNDKAIKATREFSISDLESIKSIKETSKVETTKTEVVEGKEMVNNVNTYYTNNIIETKEPTTQMSIETSNNNLSTLAINNTTLTIKLNDTNASCKLFEEGNLELTLPKNLKGIKITNAQILDANGLSAKASLKKDKIVIALSGKQTSYDIENISGGVKIVLDLEIDIENATPTHTETMYLTYGNNKVSTDLNIVCTKYGIVNITEIKGLNNQITTIDKEISEEVSMNETSKKVSIKNTYLNNYSEDVNNVEIIGTIPSIGNMNENGEDLKSTFNTKLLNEIIVRGKKAKVYYSEEVNANVDSNTWTENIKDLSKMKSYKVVLNDKLLKAGEKVEVTYDIEIPEQLSYNQISYGKSKIGYEYEGHLSAENYTIELKTLRLEGYDSNKEFNNNTETIKGLELSSYVKAGDIKLDSTNALYEKQIVKYGIRIKNISTDTISNITIKGLVPDVSTLVDMKKDNYTDYKSEWFNEYANKDVTQTISLEPGKVYTLEYYVRINNIQKDSEKIIQQYDISIEDKIIKTITNENIVKKADMQVMMMDTTPSNTETLTGTYVKYAIKVTNLTSNKLKDVEILPQIIGNINSDYRIKIAGDNEDKDISKINLEPNEVKILELYVYNNSLKNPQSLKENLTVYAGAKINNVTYYSNEATRQIKQNSTVMNVTLSSNISEDSVYDGTEIIYTIRVTNIGIIDVEADIKYDMPAGLKLMRKVLKRDGIDISYGDGESSLEFTDVNIKAGETLEIIAYTKVDGKNAGVKQELVKEDEDGIKEYKTTYYDIEEISSNVYVSGTSFENVSSNIIKYKVLYKTDKPEEPTDPEEPGEPTDPEEPSNPENPGDNNEQTTHTISGTAWLDVNKNGQRDNEEILLSGINVKLVDASNGQIAKDELENEITVVTDNNGMYNFASLAKGQYIVIFEIDTSKYTVTNYQKEGISKDINSDAIISKVTINGETKTVGITDKIEIEDEDKSSIDLGLIENAIFDLSLDKQIESITVTNAQGTKTTEYKNANFAKVDLVAKYMNNTNVIITYKFVIKNEGDVTGYIDKLVDNIPSGLQFSSDLNKDWYKGEDGNLYTTSLNGKEIKPGEKIETELILTKKTTENTTGVFSNNAELNQISNIEAIEEKTEAKENNKSSADVVISIKTGTATMYIGITIGCIAIIGTGAYIIKKKVLNKGI